MKYTCLILWMAFVCSCKKNLPKNLPPVAKQSNDAIIDEVMQPEVRITVIPTESPLPTRPYMLVDYINVQRAYNNIPQSRSYTYSYSKTVQREAGSKYSPPTKITADYDTYQLKPGIDIVKVLKCFETIPDLGAKCSVELFTDLPIDRKPEIFFDWTDGFPGHSFLQLKKSAGSKAMTLNLGFYPVAAWKMIFTSEGIPGKFVDDSKHEYNASAKMTITAAELATLISAIKLESKIIKYDIADYNCTDFAVKMFNVLRPSDPLKVPRYQIPNEASPNGSVTPQGLYNACFRGIKFSSMSRITFSIPNNKSYVEPSKIPCP